MTATTENNSTQQFSLRESGLELRDIIKTLPKECFEKDRRKAWAKVVLSVTAVALGYLGIATLPWYFLPITWIFTGTALTGWFVIGHDCGHRSFAQRRWVNDLVGHIMFLPLLYPFHSWRLMHDHHHLHTNKMDVDNAWHPWREEVYLGESPVMQSLYRGFRGRLWWMASIAHWAVLHFQPSNFALRDRAKIRTSVAAVLIFSAILFPVLIATTGFWGVVKFWLMPWLVYHFWMSTFTLVHHTAPDIQFYPTDDWNAVDSQLAGTVHCTYPKWIEVLCHDINVHIPHHLSVAIPSYRLRLAHESLRANWGEHLQEETFSWAMMKEIVDHCHLYHPENAYQSFKAVHK
ncbi:MAG: fatty acid desaturase [Synechococcales cyanobacterium T60_A2020_003]|nr:fatty acid desaturase [Synechococcales cyanobacterium T60_A2020_003]